CISVELVGGLPQISRCRLHVLWSRTRCRSSHESHAKRPLQLQGAETDGSHLHAGEAQRFQVSLRGLSWSQPRPFYRLGASLYRREVSPLTRANQEKSGSLRLHVICLSQICEGIRTGDGP